MSHDASPTPKKSWTHYAVFIVLMGLLGVNAYNLLDETQSKGGGLEGQPATAFTLESVRDDQMTTMKERPGEVVLLDFWATWCPPCKEQMPAVQAIHDDATLDDVRVLSINTDSPSPQRRGEVLGYLQRNGFTFDTLMDTGSVQASYRVRNLPTLVVIDPEGIIRYWEVGVHPESRLRELIAEARD